MNSNIKQGLALVKTGLREEVKKTSAKAVNTAESIRRNGQKRLGSGIATLGNKLLGLGANLAK